MFIKKKTPKNLIRIRNQMHMAMFLHKNPKLINFRKKKIAETREKALENAK